MQGEYHVNLEKVLVNNLRSWDFCLRSRPIDPDVVCSLVTMLKIVTVWLSNWVTKWPSDQVTEWLSDRVTMWPNDRVTEWQSDQVPEWVNDRVTKWPSNWVTEWQEASQTIDWMVYFHSIKTAAQRGWWWIASSRPQWICQEDISQCFELGWMMEMCPTWGGPVCKEQKLLVIFPPSSRKLIEEF